jgi:hypothetical protein
LTKQGCFQEKKEFLKGVKEKKQLEVAMQIKDTHSLHSSLELLR